MNAKQMWKEILAAPKAINADVVLAHAYATYLNEEMFGNR